MQNQPSSEGGANVPADLLAKRKEYQLAKAILEGTPFIDVVVRHSHLEQDSLNVISKIFPDWNESDLSVGRCTDGITNKLLKILNKPLRMIVLVRCYGAGTSSIIDRQNELLSMATLSELHFAPSLYGRFQNGFCYGFMNGQVMTSDDIGKVAIRKMVARKLAQWHLIPFPLVDESMYGQPFLWKTFDKWLMQVPERYQNEESQKKFETNEMLSLTKIRGELAYLEGQIAKHTNSSVVFCHNDLLAANIIFQPEDGLSSSSTGSLSQVDSEGELRGDVSFIDYEYGAYSYNAFDIANHFNEYAGFECDYSKFPSVEVRKEWIETYLEEFLERTPSEEEVNSLMNDVDKFSCVSHFYWGIWSLVQAKMSDIDFDYMDYAVLRFTEYYRKKSTVFP